MFESGTVRTAIAFSTHLHCGLRLSIFLQNSKRIKYYSVSHLYINVEELWCVSMLVTSSIVAPPKIRFL